MGEIKSYVMYFETSDIIRLEKSKVKDGIIEIGDKAFDVSNFKAKMLRTKFGLYPLYMLRWDCVNPAKNFNEFNPQFEINKDVNPEILKKTMNLKILGNLLKVKKPTSPLLMMFLGTILGAFIMYAILIIFK